MGFFSDVHMLHEFMFYSLTFSQNTVTVCSLRTM